MILGWWLFVGATNAEIETDVVSYQLLTACSSHTKYIIRCAKRGVGMDHYRWTPDTTGFQCKRPNDPIWPKHLAAWSRSQRQRFVPEDYRRVYLADYQHSYALTARYSDNSLTADSYRYIILTLAGYA